MKIQETAERYMVLSIALFLMAMGISFSIKAGLGITPISCPPYVFSLVPGWLTVGQFTILMHVIFVLAQRIIRGKDFPTIHYLQMVMGTIFGCFMDLTNIIIAPLEPHGYLMQLLFMAIGIVFVATGVVLQVTAKAMLIAGEGIMLTLANLWKVPFAKVKVGFDVTLVCIGIVASYAFFGEVRGVREGTILAAIFVGVLAGKIQPVLGTRVGRWLDRHHRLQPVTAIAENAYAPTGGYYTPECEYNVITIGREYGSGGHEIGLRLAEKLGWTFVDQQLINSNIKVKGINPNEISKHDQQMTERQRIWKFVCSEQFLTPGANNDEQLADETLSPEDKLFVAQGRAIREYAKHGKCIIVGRCANYFLKDELNCYNVFISSNIAFATKRIMADLECDEQRAITEIQRINHSRATHYNYYTGEQWGDSEGYDLCLRSSSLGISTVVNMIAGAVRK